jgi:hypothetical protein
LFSEILKNQQQQLFETVTPFETDRVLYKSVFERCVSLHRERARSVEDYQGFGRPSDCALANQNVGDAVFKEPTQKRFD